MKISCAYRILLQIKKNIYKFHRKREEKNRKAPRI